MPVQIQIVRHYTDSDAVVYAENVALRDNRDYLDTVDNLQRWCGPADAVRTVGIGAPLSVEWVPEVPS